MGQGNCVRGMSEEEVSRVEVRSLAGQDRSFPGKTMWGPARKDSA